MTLFSAGCATHDEVVLDLRSRQMTYNGQPVSPGDLVTLAAAHNYGDAQLTIITSHGRETKDLKAEVEELGLVGLAFMQVALTNGPARRAASD
jgi:hypothetical protein